MCWVVCLNPCLHPSWHLAGILNPCASLPSDSEVEWMSETTEWQTDKLSGACGYWAHWLRQMLCWAEGHSGKWKLKPTEDSTASKDAHLCLLITSGVGCPMFSPCRCDSALTADIDWTLEDTTVTDELNSRSEQALSQHQQPRPACTLSDQLYWCRITICLVKFHIKSLHWKMKMNSSELTKKKDKKKV